MFTSYGGVVRICRSQNQKRSFMIVRVTRLTDVREDAVRDYRPPTNNDTCSGVNRCSSTWVNDPHRKRCVHEVVCVSHRSQNGRYTERVFTHPNRVRQSHEPQSFLFVGHFPPEVLLVSLTTDSLSTSSIYHPVPVEGRPFNSFILRPYGFPPQVGSISLFYVRTRSNTVDLRTTLIPLFVKDQTSDSSSFTTSKYP